jgi:hypothetical protein
MTPVYITILVMLRDADRRPTRMEGVDVAVEASARSQKSPETGRVASKSGKKARR